MAQSQPIKRILRKLTWPMMAIFIVAIGLLAGASRALGATVTWTNGSGFFSTASNWDPTAPAAGDSTLFTNDTTYTVTLSGNTPTLTTSTISNHAGVVTINANGFTWLATNGFQVGVLDSTSTVVVAGGGTISVSQVSGAFTGSVLRVAQGTNSVASLIITNGTVLADFGIVGGSTGAVGSLVISDNGTYGPGSSGTGGSLTIGSSTSSGSRLVVTNGGKLFVDGTLTVGNNFSNSNTSAIFSGPTSAGTITSGGFLRFQGNGGSLIVSNGAKINGLGSLLFGGSCSFSTGVVVGAGSAMIFGGSAQFGLGSTGATNNFFIVSDGGFISANGTTAFGNNTFNNNNGLQIGGTGLMSTGLFTVIRSSSQPTNHFGNFMTVTNAFVSCYYLNPQGPGETVSILNKGIWNLTNSLSITPQATNTAVNINTSSGLLLIDGGTLIDLKTADNAGGLAVSGTGSITPETGRYGNMLIVTNGGVLLTSAGTIGAGVACNTAIVAGASSVWSNFSGQAVDPNYTNLLIVGTGAGGTNFLGVSDGATLYNAGTFNIGNSPTSAVNAVAFGGGGALSIVVNDGTLNVGAGNGTTGNSLTVSNANVTCLAINVGGTSTGRINNTFTFNGGTVSVGYMEVRATNTFLFNAGTLSVGGIDFDSGANNSNALVVGNGTSAAYYDMAASGTGYHDFHNGGLVVTNNAYLRGNGTLVRNVTVLGTFAPGFSAGTVIASNDLVFGASAILNYDLGASSDAVSVYGDLVLGGTVNVTSNLGFTATTYTLFTITNTLAGPAGTLSVGTMPPGYSAVVSTNTLGLVRLVVSAIGGGDPYTTWASSYGLSGGNALGAADPDGDGISNTNEFLAGFNPTNSSARLKITNVAKTDGTNVMITYLGASGDSSYTGGPSSRTNVLEFTLGTPAPNYATNAFTSAGQTNILSSGTGLGTLTSFVDTNGASGPARYYRVRVLLP